MSDSETWYLASVWSTAVLEVEVASHTEKTITMRWPSGTNKPYRCRRIGTNEAYFPTRDEALAWKQGILEERVRVKRVEVENARQRLEEFLAEHGSRRGD